MPSIHTQLLTLSSGVKTDMLWVLDYFINVCKGHISSVTKKKQERKMIIITGLV